MANIPTFDELMVPVIKALSDNAKSFDIDPKEVVRTVRSFSIVVAKNQVLTTLMIMML